ncbi:hypothetical protein BDK51DRAFT_27089, partial [Blyttiomyces helicus]
MASPIGLNEADNTVVVVLGASGDLAFKKTYPALFGLFKNGFLPPGVHIIGYARSSIEIEAFRKRVSSRMKIAGDSEQKKLDEFLLRCTYVAGKYDEAASFQRLNIAVLKAEEGVSGQKHRVFYMALPPSVFIPASQGLRENVYTESGTCRIVVEKPFGRDFDSSKVLSHALASHWKEDEIYRIDHYLGKEMVKNLMVLRFANVFFGAVWNRSHINNVQITFKEPIGTEGRGGYFDEFGIIRDILSIFAMERPVSLEAEDVRNEKVKVLRCIPPLTLDNTLLGQYTKSPDGKEPGYLEDPTVPKDSVTPTFAAARFFINNERWDGVPFVLKCGKALNEQKTEIRIQFNDVAGNIYPNLNRNELVIRVQP